MKPYEIYEAANGGWFLMKLAANERERFETKAEAEEERAKMLAEAEGALAFAEAKVAILKAQIEFEKLPEIAAGWAGEMPVFYKRGKKSFWKAPDGTNPAAWNEANGVSQERAAALSNWVWK